MKTMLLALLCLGAGAAQAADLVTFENCADSRGRNVAVTADPALPVLFRSAPERAQPEIRYNPALLPGLGGEVRLFFFAHECARHVTGDAYRSSAPTLAQARRADCLALATLIGDGLLRPERVAGLQAALRFADGEWELLPGPPRDFDLAACPPSGVVALPAAAAPTALQADWNVCIHRCGDRLYRCSKGCAGDGCESRCMEPYRQCSQACGPRPAN